MIFSLYETIIFCDNTRRRNSYVSLCFALKSFSSSSNLYFIVENNKCDIIRKSQVQLKRRADSIKSTVYRRHSQTKDAMFMFSDRCDESFSVAHRNRAARDYIAQGMYSTTVMFASALTIASFRMRPFWQTLLFSSFIT